MKKCRIKKLAIVVVTIVIGYFSLGLVELSSEKFEERTCLPGKLQSQLHEDYPRGLRWISRRATSWCMVQPPTMVMGNQTNYSSAEGSSGPEAIPNRGQWQLSFVQVKRGSPLFLPYFAVTTTSGWHWRAGCRWDQLGKYYSFPSGTIKKIK